MTRVWPREFRETVCTQSDVTAFGCIQFALRCIYAHTQNNIMHTRTRTQTYIITIIMNKVYIVII